MNEYKIELEAKRGFKTINSFEIVEANSAKEAMKKFKEEYMNEIMFMDISGINFRIINITKI